MQRTLRSLNLQHNNLDSIPYWAFTYLEQLQYLRMQGNEITSAGLNTSTETKLGQLQYVHLDRNKVSKRDGFRQKGCQTLHLLD